MTSRCRGVAVSLTLLLTLVAAGQDAPSLPELLKEYRALGLPLPPASTRLVRYETGGTLLVDGTRRPTEALAFELRPGTKGESPVLVRGADEWKPLGRIRCREVKPDAAAARDAYLDWDERVALAVQCHARGWDDLARALLVPLSEGPHPVDPRKQLVGLAWRHWEAQLTHPTADRRPAAARLKELTRRDPTLNTPTNRALLKSLDLAFVPGKGRPGTVEAEIDALVDYQEAGFDVEPGPAYWRLVERGFNAVPALIAHLNDDRLTRVRVPGFNNTPEHVLRVRDLAYGLLNGLAAEDLDSRNRRAAAAAWWTRVRRAGEEAYLFTHILPPEGAEKYPPSEHRLRVIAAKYPTRLPELYRTVLTQRPGVDSDTLAEALERAPLTAKAKLDALALGLDHPDYDHRAPALWALKSLDPKRCDALLLAELESLPADVRQGSNRLGLPRLGLTRLAIHTADPRVWAALDRTVRRSTSVQRVEILYGFGNPDEAARWVERVRFLASLVDDPAVLGERPTSIGRVRGRVSVGDEAALELAWMLDVDVPHNPERTPAEWAKVRDEMRVAARRELDRAK